MKPITGKSGGGVRPATRFVLKAVGGAARGSAPYTAQAALDPFGPPPATDPSAQTDQPADPKAALLNLLTLPEANEGALELPGGVFAAKKDVGTANVIQRDALYPFNYPTNGLPSPMFGAQPFTQKLLMFEEFGPEKLDPSVVAGTSPFPRPTLGANPEQDPAEVARSGPASVALDAFLKQAGITPFPTREANTLLSNPWQ